VATSFDLLSRLPPERDGPNELPAGLPGRRNHTDLLHHTQDIMRQVLTALIVYGLLCCSIRILTASAPSNSGDNSSSKRS
jgi:hypothetical protein